MGKFQEAKLSILNSLVVWRIEVTFIVFVVDNKIRLLLLLHVYQVREKNSHNTCLIKMKSIVSDLA